MKPPRPTPGPHASPDSLEDETPQLVHSPVQTATSMNVGGPAGDICLDPVEDLIGLGTTPTGLREAQKRLHDHLRRRTLLTRRLAKEADLLALCAGLERTLGVLYAEVEHHPPADQERSLRGEIGLVTRQLRRCQALLARLSRL